MSQHLSCTICGTVYEPISPKSFSYNHPEGAVRDKRSLTGQYLSGRRAVVRHAADREPDGRWLKVAGAACHNLKNIDVAFPVGMLTCVTGVSGSGKSSLVNDTIAAAAAFKLNRAKSIPGKHRGIEGLDYFRSVVRVDQSPIGRNQPKILEKLSTLEAVGLGYITLGQPGSKTAAALAEHDNLLCKR